MTTTTPVSEAPQLPESVRTYHSNGQVSSAKVTWDAIDPSQYAQEGSFTVTGHVKVLSYQQNFMFVFLLRQKLVQTFLTSGQVQSCHLPLHQTQIQVTR